MKEKVRSKKQNRKGKKQACPLPGHYHKFVDCPNNPKSKKYCGIPAEYEIVKDTNYDNDGENKANEDVELKCVESLDPSVAKSELCDVTGDVHNKMPFPANGAINMKPMEKAASEQDVYKSPETMSDMLRSHLLQLEVDKDDLPMDMSNFYEKYFLSADGEFDVHRSTFHNLSKFMEAMESEQLIVIKKKWQTDRKFRKRAATKHVILVGKEQVQQYVNSRKAVAVSQKRDNDVTEGGKHARSDETEDSAVSNSKKDDVILQKKDDCGRGDEPAREDKTKVVPSDDIVAVPVSESAPDTALKEGMDVVHDDDATQTKEEIDEQLRICFTDLVVDENDLPMKMGDFFRKYMKPFGLDVSKSTYSTVTKFLRAMDNDVFVFMERRDRGRSAYPFIVAIGGERVRHIKMSQAQKKKDDPEPVRQDVYKSPETMSDILRNHLLHLEVDKDDLPMDMSNFYEKYFLSADGEFDVHRSTFHNLSKFMEAMESEQLIVIKKKWQTDRKFRKRAATKHVVLVGKEQVQRYVNSRKSRTITQKRDDDVTEGGGRARDESVQFPAERAEDTSVSKPKKSYTNQQKKEDNDIEDENAREDKTKVVPSYDVEDVPFSASMALQDTTDITLKEGDLTDSDLKEDTAGVDGDAVPTKEEIDEQLKTRLADLVVDTRDMPMAIGDFFQKYMKPFGLDVRKSSYSSVTKFFRTMEKDGYVLLKKQYRFRSSYFVVLAVGTEQVKRFFNPDPSIEECVHASDLESSSSSDESDGEDYAHINMKPTIHAKVRQKSRGITDRDLLKAIDSPKKSGRRRRGGVREVSADGVTAIVTCGQKNKVITTWKDESAECHYLDKWTQEDRVALNADYEVRGGQKQIVTISETFQRHRKSTNKNRKGRSYTKGELVIKNKRKRKNFLVVGLEKNVIDDISKQIMSQIGCRVTIGKLSMDSWIDTHGQSIAPLAKEGSGTIAFDLAAVENVISRVMKQLEQVVPPECRRYLREEQEGDLFSIREIGDITGSSFVDKEKEVRQIQGEIIRIYKQHAPPKMNDVPGLMEKYRGRENELLHAVKRKYL